MTSNNNLAKTMHQYYRDAFSQDFTFPDVGDISRDLLLEIIQSKSCDIANIAERIFAEKTNLPDDKDKALKLAALIICQSNLYLDKNLQGKSFKPTEVFLDSIRNGLSRVLTLDPNEHYLTIAAQLLYRLGDIDGFLKIIESQKDLLIGNFMVKKMLSMIYVINNEYELALPILADLIEDPVESKNSLVSLMAMTCMHKLGGVPEAPIDFSIPSIVENEEIMWVFDSKKSKDLTVFVACDEKYFFDHVVALIYSIYEKNDANYGVHIHLYNKNKSIVNKIKSIKEKLPLLVLTVTSEDIYPEHPRVNVDYASRRFVAARQVIHRLNSDIVICDADGLFRKSLGEINLDGADVIYASSDSTPFWEKIPAGFVVVKNNPAGREFLENTANFISHNLKKNNHMWFLDQIALSVCYDRADKDKTAFVTKPMSEFCDTDHNDNSFFWVVTTVKNGSVSYEDYKNYLLEKYDGISLKSFSDIFLNLSVNQENVYFLQVGAMDGVSYDPIHRYVKNFKWKGVLVEPLPDMMQRLRMNYAGCEDLIFENVAISDEYEVKTIYRVEPEVISKNNLPHWLQGMSTFLEGKLKDYEAYVSEHKINCEPLMDLINRHNLPRIDVLQIDTEGFDYKIFKQFDFSKYRPSVINIEFINLNKDDLINLKNDLSKNNYFFYRNDMDIIAVDAKLFHKDVLH